MSSDAIIIRGASQHNLRQVDLSIPRNSLTVLTGVSGSGKSSLAFDTLYAEGQRRYVESLSSYARQFLNRTPKPDVQSITGLAPAISIEQKGAGHNPRSTVGTITEIYDYLRIVFSAIGKQHCPDCGSPIGAQTSDQVVARILALPQGASVNLMAPVARERKGEFKDLIADMRRAGYARARVDGTVVGLDQELNLDRRRRHSVEIILDRGVIGSDGFCAHDAGRVTEAIENGARLGEGSLLVAWEHDGTQDELLVSTKYSCPACNRSFTPPSPAAFSFNTPQGMCATCGGLGTAYSFVPELLVVSPDKSLLDGAIPLLPSLESDWHRHFYEGVARHYGFTLETPWNRLTRTQRHHLLYGSGSTRIEFHFKDSRGRWERKHARPWEGVIPFLADRHKKTRSERGREKFESSMRQTRCPDCKGGRLNAVSLAVKLGDSSIAEINEFSVADAQRFFNNLSLGPVDERIAGDALREVRQRIAFLMDVGLHYLTLDRTAPTLSGGESQRIRLASQVGSGLVGVVYILDEPSIGLHNRDNIKLLHTLARLRDRGNTVVVVEHDEETMRAADFLVDFGPGAGECGGRIVAAGPVDKVLRSRDSLTAKYLRGDEAIPVPSIRRPYPDAELVVHGARQNNLRDIDVAFPLGRLICVTGVSGSGKSSLVNDILYEALAVRLNGAEMVPGAHDRIAGVERLDKVINIDQSPIGRTPRSNPATYVGVFDPIRALLAETADAQLRGYAPGRFSFNVPGGRCEACEGNGAVLMEMDFLADVWSECEVCGGRRFNRETLEIAFKGKNVAEILDMSVSEALEHFRNLPAIHRMVTTLHDVGLDYIRLGQPAPTLSGGEAQRIKLAAELCRASTGRTLYVLDEPTTGLHFHDIQNLLTILHRLVDEGNTVVVVEHNLEVIKTADHIIDLGPEGGPEGGRIVAAGTPEEIAAHAESHTGASLRSVLKTGTRSSHRRSTAAVRVVPGRKEGSEDRAIVIRNARENNLRNVSIEIPRGKTTVFSGPSGSGKTSLAMDTLFAEGQRRYITSLSSYARQFLGQMRKPAVDTVEGLSPAICIEQRMSGHTPRSTVGTVTEVYDYLRALYARIGAQHCPTCKVPATALTSSRIVDRIVSDGTGRAVMLLAPVAPRENESHAELFTRLLRAGYHRVRIDANVTDLDAGLPDVNDRQQHRIEVVVARIANVSARQREAIAEAVEKSLDLSGGRLIVHDPEDGTERAFSQKLSCPTCLRTFEPVEPRALSFNHAQGWCPACEGLGMQRGVDPSVPVASPSLSIRDGALQLMGPLVAGSLAEKMFEEVARRTGMDLDTPWERLPDASRQLALHGAGDQWFSAGTFTFRFMGAIDVISNAANSVMMARQLRHLVHDQPCGVCQGSRLNPVASAVKVAGRSLADVCGLPLEQAARFFDSLSLTPRERHAACEVLDEIRRRLRFLVEVGLEYVTLNRAAPTLSGGESQRIRLASQIGSGLTGVLYILDEPTIGLHPCDNARLLASLRRLRDLGNTLVVVEHDRDTLESADHLVDFGPGAGPAGGRVTAQGSPARVKRIDGSLTGNYLSGSMRIPVLKDRRVPAPIVKSGKSARIAAGWLTVVGARHHNLQNITIRFPLATLTCVTGPSGSGKSTLVNDILHNELAAQLHRANTVAGMHDRIDGIKQIEKAICIDQAPIGHGHRSDPSTYTGVFDQIRDLFAQLPDAKVRGYTVHRFSYNRPGGRCEACYGLGSRCIEMHFLPDVWVQCEACNGARFNKETLAVHYKGKSIADVLRMSVDEAAELFKYQPRLVRTLRTMIDVGLGYMELGQAASTLSGGEAQRIKLARELSRPTSGRALYLLDEPTTGLHMSDIQKLLAVLHRLVEGGNTVVIIEHNMEVIASADWVIDMGPGGGENGGRIVAEGTPEQVAACTASATAPFLRAALERSRRVTRRELLDTVSAPAARGSLTPETEEIADVKSPWESDGKAWHLEKRTVPGKGRPAWRSEALRSLTDAVSALHPGLSIHWDHESYVDARFGEGRAAIFMRVRTDEYWWFRVLLRTRKGLFAQDPLRARLRLPVWDDVKELQVYGKWPRVHVLTRNPRWDEVWLFLWCREDIETPAFRRFLKECFGGYYGCVKERPSPRRREEHEASRRGTVGKKGTGTRS